MDRRSNGPTDRWNGRTGGQMDGRANGWTDGRKTDGWTDGRKRWTDSRLERMNQIFWLNVVKWEPVQNDTHLGYLCCPWSETPDTFQERPHAAVPKDNIQSISPLCSNWGVKASGLSRLRKRSVTRSSTVVIYCHEQTVVIYCHECSANGGHRYRAIPSGGTTSASRVGPGQDQAG